MTKAFFLVFGLATLAGLKSAVGQADPCVADLNNDGGVDVQDLLALLAAFGVGADGDTDGDGETDVADLLFLLSAFGAAGCSNAPPQIVTITTCAPFPALSPHQPHHQPPHLARESLISVPTAQITLRSYVDGCPAWCGPCRRLHCKRRPKHRCLIFHRGLWRNWS